MNFYVGVTDHEWFGFLRERKPDEVNFWFPSSKQGFAALQPGEPFLFKLHSPYNIVAGGGFFVRYSALPLSLAGEAFGEKNGAPDYTTCHKRVTKYKKGVSEPDPVIGCVVLTEPFFFEDSQLIPSPSNWSREIVRGKVYSTAEPIGDALWMSVAAQLAPQPAQPTLDLQYEQSQKDAYKLVLGKQRLGQGAFRVLVTDAYHRRCAISGEKTLPVLTAAHIKPYSQQGPHELQNGLLLRADLHLLFDRGLLTITDDYRVEVSQRIKETYNNGKEYYRFQGQKLLEDVLPNKYEDRPSTEYLKWHQESTFR